MTDPRDEGGSSNPLAADVAQHYGSAELGETIFEALARSGKDLEKLRPEDLAPIDAFHIRGREATLELAGAAKIRAADRVLDVGSGLGGTARTLAATLGCRVVGLDVTADFCRVATLLSEQVGLAERVSFHHGDALDLPFDEGAFDVVWSEHAAMNIADKPRLYSEMYRVLAPGGRVAIYDVLAGPDGPVYFPVPWTREPESSFLVTPDELRILLEEAGFEITVWDDTTEEGRDWFAAMISRVDRDGPPTLGFHLVLGPDFAQMAKNQLRNLEEGRIVLAQVVGVRSERAAAGRASGGA